MTHHTSQNAVSRSTSHHRTKAGPHIVQQPGLYRPTTTHLPTSSCSVRETIQMATVGGMSRPPTRSRVPSGSCQRWPQGAGRVRTQQA